MTGVFWSNAVDTMAVGEGKGYRKELLVGVYRLVLKILSLFQAKSCHVLWMAPASCLRT